MSSIVSNASRIICAGSRLVATPHPVFPITPICRRTPAIRTNKVSNIIYMKTLTPIRISMSQGPVLFRVAAPSQAPPAFIN